MKKEVREYFKRMGRKGGLKKSPAKTKAARLNILKRWSKVKTVEVSS